MKIEKAEKNYWPIGLLIFGTVFCIAVISMIFVATNNKWEQDKSFMSDYKSVDKHYNEIALSQKAFDANYDISFDSAGFVVGANKLILSVKDKNGSFVKDANITAIVTRPDTNQFNQTITNFSISSDNYVSAPFTLEKMGRWIVEYKIDVNNTNGYFKIERQTPRN
jgi:nitrogen fixation protein FixH